ncbi:MAG: helix-turn-helix domain-containing protein [Clostridia bacterium]|nr:helix-turn-helix domain-containing protein [Clostridia bacterium]
MQYDRFELQDICLFHTAVPPGQRNYREHFHTECEISFLLGGAGTYLVDGKEYAFRRGDVLLFGSNEAHCITEILQGEPFDMLTVKFEPKMLWNGENGAAFVLLKLFFGRSERFSNLIDRENPATPAIGRMMMGMEREFRTRPRGYELKVRLDLYTVLLILLREYGYVTEEPLPPTKDRSLRQLAAAMDYIDANLSQTLTLEEIAAKAAMSKAYFSTIFKKYNGITLWDYITIKRVEKAIALIGSTGMTKLQIAAECGFASPANFYKAFRRVTGKTPSNYKA